MKKKNLKYPFIAFAATLALSFSFASQSQGQEVEQEQKNILEKESQMWGEIASDFSTCSNATNVNIAQNQEKQNIEIASIESTAIPIVSNQDRSLESDFCE